MDTNVRFEAGKYWGYLRTLGGQTLWCGHAHKKSVRAAECAKRVRRAVVAQEKR